MSKFVKVADFDGLARDMHSLGVVSTNESAYKSAIEKAKKAQESRDQIRDAVREINTLKSEMHEIKRLLTQLVEK